jgi:hypothetical protein
MWQLLAIPSARSRIFSALSEGLLLGQLEIKDRYGRHIFGKRGEGRPVARMDVHNDRLWIRIVLSADLGCTSSKGCIFSVWPCLIFICISCRGVHGTRLRCLGYENAPGRTYPGMVGEDPTAYLDRYSCGSSIMRRLKGCQL